MISAGELTGFSEAGVEAARAFLKSRPGLSTFHD